ALPILTHYRGAIALGHLAELEVADLDDGLVRRVGGAAQELRRELLERLVEVALPEAVGLHRVEVRVHDLEAVLHRDSSSRWLRPPGIACAHRVRRWSLGQV